MKIPGSADSSSSSSSSASSQISQEEEKKQVSDRMHLLRLQKDSVDETGTTTQANEPADSKSPCAGGLAPSPHNDNEEDEDDYAFDECTGLRWRKMDLLYFETVAKSEGFDSINDPGSRICGAIRPYPIDKLDEEELAVIDLAIQEHNEKMQKVNNSEDILKFKRIVKVNYQVVTGCRLYYTLELTNAGGACRYYELEAWVWSDESEIYTFRPAIHYPPPSTV